MDWVRHVGWLGTVYTKLSDTQDLRKEYSELHPFLCFSFGLVHLIIFSSPKEYNPIAVVQIMNEAIV